MCLSWSQPFRSTLGTLCKLHMLAAANAFFSIRQLQLCNTHAPTISISIFLNHTITFTIVSSSYMVFLHHTQIICVHGTSILTLPLCPLVFINICFLLQAHSICLCILLSFEIQITQTLTTFHHLKCKLPLHFCLLDWDGLGMIWVCVLPRSMRVATSWQHLPMSECASWHHPLQFLARAKMCW